MVILRNESLGEVYTGIFRDLRTDPEDVDVVEIRCKDGVKISTSRLLLALSSEFLQGILSNLESLGCCDEGVIHLPDVESETVQRLLEFLSDGVVYCDCYETTRQLNDLCDLIKSLQINSSASFSVNIREDEDEFVVRNELKSEEIAKNEMETDDENDNFCDKCHSFFGSKEDLERHLKTVYPDEPWTCRFCGRKFKNKVFRDNHKKIHTGGVSQFCKICKKKLSKTHYYAHMKNHLEGAEMEFCEYCGKEFAKRYLKHHIANQHTSLSYEFECEVCQRKFKTKQIMITHKLVHLSGAERRKFICDTCGYATVSKDRLKSHKQSHVKPFRCHKCDKSYSTKVNLESHISAHYNERLFKCEKCDRAFNNRGGLSRHYAVVHVPSHNYQCKICSSASKTLTGMKYHLISHSNTEPFHCGVCNATFRHKEVGRRHMKADHPEEKNVGVKFIHNEKIKELENTAIINLSTVTKLQQPV